MNYPNQCTHSDGPFHSCSYVDERNSKIRLAEDQTIAVHGNPSRNYLAKCMSWDSAFLRAMNRLMNTPPVVQ